MEKQNIPSTITLKKSKVVAHHISDGSKLISSEIQASTLEEIKERLNKSLEDGYAIDEGIIINNYATEPDMYLVNYPSLEQQKCYAFLGAGASPLITLTLLTTFALS